MSIIVRQAKPNEIDWINTKYREVDFVESSYHDEFIVIAECDGEPAGLGRLVVIDENNIELGGIYSFPSFRGKGIARHIVSALSELNPYPNSTIWCLPFENLLDFYGSFGFSQKNNTEPPNEILRKLDWCNKADRYTSSVLLLSKSA